HFNNKIIVPYAVTADFQKVIYAYHGEHRGFNKSFNLIPYDTEVSQIRQRMCVSELSILAKKHHVTTPSVNIVSQGVKRFLTRKNMETNGEIKKIIHKKIGHYFYTNGSFGYGRISRGNKDSFSAAKIWDDIIYLLDYGFLEQQLAIHDAVGRKIIEPTDIETKKYNCLTSVREAWFDDREQRGRIESSPFRKKNVTPTNEMGILQEKVKGIESLTQYHNRGIDMFVRDLNRKRNPSADLYYDDLDTHNLVFGAGISGTTGTLLQAAYAFGGIVNGELLKQYTLAIIIYLIGGGMHSYHEVLSIAKKVGLYYSPGSFHWLPLSFKLNNEYGKWKEKYYDIVKMGTTHWRFNQGVPPSHLNKNLRS
ncbi:TPA: hypothetical protein IBI57_004980, partial [Escherichia coli]|nr:hypothetical protein [Escherichia coli]